MQAIREARYKAEASSRLRSAMGPIFDQIERKNHQQALLSIPGIVRQYRPMPGELMIMIAEHPETFVREDIIKELETRGAGQFEALNYENAFGYYFVLNELAPKDIEILISLNMVCCKLGDYRKMLRFAEQIASLGEEHQVVSQETQGIAHLMLGESYQAQKIFSVLLKRNPFSSSAQIYQGFACLFMGDYKSAEIYFLNVNTSNPGGKLDIYKRCAALGLGLIFSHDKKDIAAVQNFFAVAEDGCNTSDWEDLCILKAMGFAAEKDQEQALECLKQVRQKSPTADKRVTIHETRIRRNELSHARGSALLGDALPQLPKLVLSSECKSFWAFDSAAALSSELQPAPPPDRREEKLSYLPDSDHGDLDPRGSFHKSLFTKDLGAPSCSLYESQSASWDFPEFRSPEKFPSFDLWVVRHSMPEKKRAPTSPRPLSALSKQDSSSVEGKAEEPGPGPGPEAQVIPRAAEIRPKLTELKTRPYPYLLAEERQPPEEQIYELSMERDRINRQLRRREEQLLQQLRKERDQIATQQQRIAALEKRLLSTPRDLETEMEQQKLQLTGELTWANEQIKLQQDCIAEFMQEKEAIEMIGVTSFLACMAEIERRHAELVAVIHATRPSFTREPFFEEFATLQLDYLKLQAAYEALKAGNERLIMKAQKSEADHKSAKAEIEALTQQQTTLQKRVAELWKSHSSAISGWAVLCDGEGSERKFLEMQKENEKLKSQVTELTSYRAEAESLLGEQLKYFEELQKFQSAELQRLRSEMGQRLAKERMLRLRATQTPVESGERQLQHFQMEMQQYREATEQRFKSQQQQLNLERSENARLQSELEKEHRKNEKLAKERELRREADLQLAKQQKRAHEALQLFQHQMLGKRGGESDAESFLSEMEKCYEQQEKINARLQSELEHERKKTVVKKSQPADKHMIQLLGVSQAKLFEAASLASARGAGKSLVPAKGVAKPKPPVSLPRSSSSPSLNMTRTEA